MFRAKERVLAEDDRVDVVEQVALLGRIVEFDHVAADGRENLLFERMMRFAAEHPDEQFEENERR